MVDIRTQVATLFSNLANWSGGRCTFDKMGDAYRQESYWLADRAMTLTMKPITPPTDWYLYSLRNSTQGNGPRYEVVLGYIGQEFRTQLGYGYTIDIEAAGDWHEVLALAVEKANEVVTSLKGEMNDGDN